MIINGSTFFRENSFMEKEPWVTFIHGALIGTRARAWLGLKRLGQMHPKTQQEVLFSRILFPSVHRSSCSIRMRERERERGGGKERGRERRDKERQFSFLSPDSLLLRSMVLFLSTESCLPSIHMYARTHTHTHTHIRKPSIHKRYGMHK